MSTKTHIQYKYTCILKIKGWRKIYHCDTNQKKVGLAVLISDKGCSEEGKQSGLKKALHND